MLTCQGGTNGHVIIDAGDVHQPLGLNEGTTPVDSRTNRIKGAGPQKHRLFALSHEHKDGISRLALDLKEYMEKRLNVHEALDDFQLLDNLAYTLSARRSRLAVRSAVSADSVTSLMEALGNITGNSSKAYHRALEDPKLCFVFPGMPSCF